MVVPEESSFKDVESRIKQVKSIMGEISIIIRQIEKNKSSSTEIKSKPELQRKIVGELAEFMSLQSNTSTRSAVLKFISTYVKENRLQKSQDKRYFSTDEKLSKLLSVDLNTKITFLGINKHISHLFLKK